MNSKEFEKRLLDNWTDYDFDISKIIGTENDRQNCHLDLIMSEEIICREINE